MGLCFRGEEREKAVKLAMEAVEKIEVEVMKGKKVFGSGDDDDDDDERNIGYLDICLGWISYWLPVWEEVGCIQIIDPFKFPATTSWINAFLHHPVIADNLPPRDAMIEYFRKRSIDIFESLNAVN